MIPSLRSPCAPLLSPLAAVACSGAVLGQSWLPRTAAAPGARHLHALAWDAALAEAALFGGMSGKGFPLGDPGLCARVR